MARRRTPKLKLNPFKKPTRKKATGWLFGLRDQRGNAAWTRRYDLMRTPQY